MTIPVEGWPEGSNVYVSVRVWSEYLFAYIDGVLSWPRGHGEEAVEAARARHSPPLYIVTSIRRL